jgi:putative hydrolase of the HAD superfamily/hydrolase
VIRAIIFDCFGVIISDALKVVVAELEVSNPAAARQIVDIIHANNRGLIVPAESNRQIAEVLGTSVQAWRKRIDQGEVKDERALAFIRELRRSYKTALLSNIGNQSLERRFSDAELRGCFDEVIISGDLGIVKPEPEIYLHAAAELGVEPSECVMVDDREKHCDGARATGMQTVLYQNFEQGRQTNRHCTIHSNRESRK